MAFTFNCIAQDVAANSYVCESEADDYFDGDPRQTSWDTLTAEQKQQYLVRATNRLEYENYSGAVTDTTQALQWPRNFIADRNGSYYTETTIPTPMKKATYEMAFWYLEEITEVPLVSRTDQERMSEFTIGPLSAKMRKIAEATLPDEVKRALNSIGARAWLGGAPLKLVR